MISWNLSGAKLYRPFWLAILAEAYAKEGQAEEGLTLLAEVYNWFTEGFDTKDLQEAQALLAELQG